MIYQFYFSPTGSSKKIAQSITSGITSEGSEEYDLTLPGHSPELQLKEGVAIFSAPVYAGRVAIQFLERIAKIKGNDTPAVVLVSYGNRAYEDALLELSDVVSAQGFKVIGAAAFIGEHSYATADYPVALGRPLAADLAKATDFGRKISSKLALNDFTQPAIPGNAEYRERTTFGGIAPSTDEATCTACGQCVSLCPTGIISLNGKIATDASGCTMCCACVKGCPTGARSFNPPPIQEKRALLTKNCSQPKQPELFL